MILPVRSEKNLPEKQIRRVFPEAGGGVQELDEDGPKYKVAGIR